MADIDRLIGFMAIMQVPFMNDPDALAYIEEVKTVLKQAKTQEPRVMTLEEVLEWKQPDVWYEKRENGFGDAVTPLGRFEFAFMTSVCINGKNHEDGTPITTLDYYGKSWRCWTARPTDEQREAAMWDG